MKIFIALACAFLLPELTNGNLGFGGNQGNFYHGIGGQLSGLSGNGNQYISQPYTSPYIPDPYEHFCQYFYDLRSISQGNNLDAVIHQEILKAIFQMGRRLEMEIPGFNVFQAPKLEDCRDPNICAYLFYKRLSPMENEFFNSVYYDDVREVYVELWLLHPLMRRCLPYVKKDLKSINAKVTLVEGLLDARKPVSSAAATILPSERFIKVLVGKSGKVLRDEIRRSCEKPKSSDQVFCSSLPELVQLVDSYQTAKGSGDSSPQWNAYLLHFLMLKYNFPSEFQQVQYPQVNEANDLMIKNLEVFFEVTSNKQTDRLRDLLSLVPDLKTIKSGCHTTWNLPRNSKKSVCVFWKAIIQMKIYAISSTPPANGKVTEVLNTNIDYQNFLSLNEMNNILTAVENQANAQNILTDWLSGELKKEVNDRFHGLKTYFQQVESFNRAKADSDVAYASTKLEHYASEVGSLTDELGSSLERLINWAIAAVSAEAAEDLAQVTVSTFAYLNPVEAVFVSSSLNEFADRVNKLAHTLNELGEMLNMKDSLDNLFTQSQSIKAKFNENSEFLEVVRSLVQGIASGASTDNFEEKKQKFLYLYNKYDPKVGKPELTALTSLWETMIDDTCDTILGQDTGLAAAMISHIQMERACPKTKVLAQKMIESYVEVYDFQFELIEAMASYMRATTAVEAANSIVGNYEQLPSVVDQNDVKIPTLASLVVYKTALWKSTDDFCNILEYKEGGVLPSVCEGLDTNIASLASYVSPTCRNVEEYKDIPIDLHDKLEFLSDLYSGKVVSFQIPDADWLVSNKWINSRDRDSAIFVKNLEVFLPTSSAHERNVRVEWKAVGMNYFTPSNPTSKRYAIVPRKKSVFEYNEGRGAPEHCMKESSLLNNPYGPNLPKICPLNVDDNSCDELLQKTPLFPSVYSKWKISISGYESARIPNPANQDFAIKFGVKLCILQRKVKDKGINLLDPKRRGKGRKRNKKQQQRNNANTIHCQDGQYWSLNKGACTPCPSGSYSALDGYYCEQNQA